MRAFNWRHRSVLLVPFIQLGVLSFAVVSSLTRITDHRHHWWDVLTGSAIGIITLLYAVSPTIDHISQTDSQVTTQTRQTQCFWGRLNAQKSPPLPTPTIP